MQKFKIGDWVEYTKDGSTGHIISEIGKIDGQYHYNIKWDGFTKAKQNNIFLNEQVITEKGFKKI
jgi:hypothetical protein